MLLLRVFLVATLALQPVWLSAQALSLPESVRYDAANARFLTSNRSGGGSIQARDLTGILTPFTTEPISPAGIEIVGDLFYVANQTNVRTCALATGLPVSVLAIPGAPPSVDSND